MRFFFLKKEKKRKKKDYDDFSWIFKTIKDFDEDKTIKF